MVFPFRRRRSNGVPVGRRAFGLIRLGDAARDRGDWAAAATFYEMVLERAPKLWHIHVQLGHAFAETRRLPDSLASYQRARSLRPKEREPLLHIAHALNRLERYDQAATAYVELLERDLDDDDAVRGSVQTVQRLVPQERAAMLARIRRLVADDLDAVLPKAPASERPHGAQADGAIVYDVSDLVAFFGHSRRPTGIQRVQIETVRASLRDPAAAGRVVLCCMSDRSDVWVELPSRIFLSLASASVDDALSDAAWRRMRNRPRLALLFADPLAMPMGATLVNLGASWWLGNYFLALRDAKRRYGVRYVPFVHDLIPIVSPQHHTAELIDEFTVWLEGALAHADGFLVNSQATRRDLMTTAGAGAPPTPPRIEVVPLNAADVATRSSGVLPVQVDAAGFVLFVGTIEPRKGHLTALRAWAMLMASRPSCPQLVLVGRKGWKTEEFFALLQADGELHGRVVILSDVGDGTLTALYDRALLVLYPSSYEGWGLPVTEALSRGKLVITTTASSLPEAGGSLAAYVPPDDAGALADEVARWIDDPHLRREREARIRAEFRPRTWTDIARQVELAARRMPARPGTGGAAAAAIAPLAYHYLSRRPPDVDGIDIRPGEQLRTGRDWHWPGDAGCAVRGGGQLAFASPASPECLYAVAVLLRGDLMGCAFRTTCDGEGGTQGMLGLGERAWVRCTMRPDPEGIVRVTIAGVPCAGDGGSMPIVEGLIAWPAARPEMQQAAETVMDAVHSRTANDAACAGRPAL